MLLAGGQGSRLCGLTESIAKPAVGFGAKYRIIDFTLSNCTHAGIDTVGVLTQYQPLVLNEYIGTGEAWDLDRSGGGVHVLPPYLAKEGGSWYKGTANAVYQNLNFLKRYPSKVVLILSGDHIYKMDYSDLISYHQKKNADCSIAVIDVPKDTAHQFGILDFDKENKITTFLEKPANPPTTHASMGVYVFNTEILIAELEKDESDNLSSNDFGKNIIPNMLASGKKLFAYPFSGYWKDVGTLNSLWQANMDLLEPDCPLHFTDPAKKIYSKNSPLPPAFIANSAKVKNCILTAGSKVKGSVIDSIISEGVVIEEGAEVYKSVLLKGSKVGKNAKVSFVIVDEEGIVASEAVIKGTDCNIALVERK